MTHIRTNKIIVILGPTSSGKSDIAIKLAKKFNGEVISADSRQVYRGMDVGTGKIRVTYNVKRETLSGGIRHHMLDIVSPRTNYNVAKFKKQTEKVIRDILHRGKLPIICGGTGFWISAIVDNIDFPKVKPDWKLRKKLEKYSAEKLFTMLRKLDSARARTIDKNNKVRLIRALEIIKRLGKVPLVNYELGIRNYEFLQIGIKLSKRQLHKNIEKRVRYRFRQGMIAEVKKLHRRGLPWKKIQSFGLAYFWIPLYLQKKLSFGELRTKASKEKSLALLAEKIIQAEKNYAKRQMTWFRRDKRIKWLKNHRQIEKEVKIFLV